MEAVAIVLNFHPEGYEMPSRARCREESSFDVPVDGYWGWWGTAISEPPGYPAFACEDAIRARFGCRPDSIRILFARPWPPHPYPARSDWELAAWCKPRHSVDALALGDNAEILLIETERMVDGGANSQLFHPAMRTLEIEPGQRFAFRIEMPDRDGNWDV